MGSASGSREESERLGRRDELREIVGVDDLNLPTLGSDIEPLVTNLDL